MSLVINTNIGIGKELLDQVRDFCANGMGQLSKLSGTDLFMVNTHPSRNDIVNILQHKIDGCTHALNYSLFIEYIQKNWHLDGECISIPSSSLNNAILNILRTNNILP